MFESKRLRARVVAVGAAVAALAVFLVPGAEAVKVVNPGQFLLVPTQGELTFQGPTTQTRFDLTSTGTPKIEGTIDAAGNINVPVTGISFPAVSVPVVHPVDGSVSAVFATLIPTAPATGNLNPNTGAATLSLTMRVGLSGFPFGIDLGAGCTIGNAGSPIRVTLITGTTTPPAGVQPLQGSPYRVLKDSAGNPYSLMRLVDNNFGVPGVAGCNTFPLDLNGLIAQNIGLPAPAGKASITMTAGLKPIITPGIQPSVAIVPVSAAGPAPLNVTFDAGGTTVAKGPATYSWTFSDGTTGTGVSVSHTYVNTGFQSATLKVTDADGDTALLTKYVTVQAPGSTTTTASTTTTTAAPTTTTTASTTTTTAKPTTTTTAPATTTTASTTTTTTAKPTTTTTAPATTTTASTTTTTASTTTTTAKPTTTTTASTTTTTTAKPTTTTTSTSVVPQGTSGLVTVRVGGGVKYLLDGPAAAPGLRIGKGADGRVDSLSGQTTVTGPKGSPATVTFDLHRVWIFDLFVGSMALRDPAAGLDVAMPVIDNVAITTNTAGITARGVARWFTFGAWPDLIRPFTVEWSATTAG